MQISTRNQLLGTITSITLGNIVAEIVIELRGGQEIVSVISYLDSERMNLQVGDQITVLVQTSDVMIAK